MESPHPLLGSFNRDFLQLPSEVLVTVMRKHQRYFPVVAAGSASEQQQQGHELLPYFVAVPNGQLDEEAVRSGNEAVLR